VLGAELDFGVSGLRPEVLLFNETQTRVIVSVAQPELAAALALLESRGTPARLLGSVTGATGDGELIIKADGAETHWQVAGLHHAWYGAIPECMSI
jgi:phosphoribosylformylglycinamidine synthase